MFCWLKYFARACHRVSVLSRAADPVIDGVILPTMQQLERRRLLASSCTGTNTSDITYDGDSASQTITASTSGGTFTVTDGSVSCSSTQTMTSLVIRGNGGNDVITINTSVSIPTISIEGNDGADSITGGNGGKTFKAEQVMTRFEGVLGLTR